tara:strand:- start:924 stop:1256 length:333 start_codon:yes stop_codon:yes gene_type:complete
METEKKLNFPEFILSYVSLSVIAGLFTYRVINSLLDNIIFPIIDLTILPDHKFLKYSVFFNSQKIKVDIPNISNTETNYFIRYGIFLKDFIIWSIIMIILFIIYNFSLKI